MNKKEEKSWKRKLDKRTKKFEKDEDVMSWFDPRLGNVEDTDPHHIRTMRLTEELADNIEAYHDDAFAVLNVVILKLTSWRREKELKEIIWARQILQDMIEKEREGNEQ